MPPKKRRGREQPLRREEIVAAAIEAADRGELQRVTMRGLAEQLGVTPMALYAHVDDKDDLLDEVLEHVLRRDAAPKPYSPDHGWRAWMVDFAEQLHTALAGHPAVFDRYCRHPAGAPAALERMEAAITVLSTAGFDDVACVDVYATVVMLTLGFTALDAARRTAEEDAGNGRSSRGLDRTSPHYWPALFASLPPEHFPRLSRLQPDLHAFTSPLRFRHGLTVLLDGLDPATMTKEVPR